MPFTVGQSGVTGPDAIFGGTTLLDFFTTNSGAQGDDTVDGGIGNDTLIAVTGSDALAGGGDKDTIIGGKGGRHDRLRR